MTDAQLLSKLIHLIAEILEVSVEEVEDDSSEFSELGIDAISARAILSKLEQSTGLKLPENTFQKCHNLGNLRQYITECNSTLTSTGESRAKPRPGEAVAVLLRGSRSQAPQNLFLLPDGSGSAMAYARIPDISPACCVYALQSPFLRDATRYTCSIEDLSSTWAQEIQDIQPSGPYRLGGWSAGGYYAYEVMKVLQRRGHVVEKVVLIDSPCRLTHEAMPLEILSLLSSQNLMGASGTEKVPEWLVSHFKATIQAVQRYKPEPLRPDVVVPQVFLIWASDGLTTQASDVQKTPIPDATIAHFLLERRERIGVDGWNTLFPRTEILTVMMPGNHFNLVHLPYVSAHSIRLMAASIPCITGANTDAQARDLARLLGNVMEGRTESWTRV